MGELRQGGVGETMGCCGIARYTVQVLTRKVKEEGRSYITLRLYDDDNVCRGITIFEDHGSDKPPKPTGDYKAQVVTTYIDISAYSTYMDVLRLESPLYLKMNWTQPTKKREVSHVTIDTRKEVTGDFSTRAIRP